MKEYTILSVISVVAALVLERLSGVRVLRRRAFQVFLLIIFGFMLLVNGYLTGMFGDAIVLYEPRFFLGIRLISIPIEDFMFGFSMIMLAVVVWERTKSAMPEGQ